MNHPITRVPRMMPQSLNVLGAGKTHVGLVRKVNEDAILTDPSGVLWAVADGMGGYGHGDIAADIVIDCLSRLPHAGDAEILLRMALTDANAQIFQKSRENDFGTMGATVVAALIYDTHAHIAWVGDSRACLVRNGEFRRLTKDHSLVQELVDAGTLQPELAEAHPQSNVVTRAIGAAEQVQVAFTEIILQADDWLLLYSDGLSKTVGETAITRHLAECQNTSQACIDLIRAALLAGGPDNVSVIAVQLREG